jgi:hypothetical protein
MSYELLLQDSIIKESKKWDFKPEAGEKWSLDVYLSDENCCQILRYYWKLK